MANKKLPATGTLSEDGLKHFKTYKYSSVDLSPISHYILRHYWNFCVEYLPLWLAPNMVTLIGFMFVIGNVGLQQLADPDLVGPQHSWVYYSYAFGVWAYSTMDNIDGKQARRTGTSSGLGELFDHGIDSLNCTLASLLEVSAMGLGATPLGALTALVPCLPMFFSTWETYHTHTLYLGYFNGPTEGLMIASLIMWASGYWGPHIWHEPIAQAVGFEHILGKLSVKDIWAPLLLVAFSVAHLPGCVYNVVQARKAKGLPLAPVFLEWSPMILYCAALVAWLGSPYSTLLRDNHLCLLCLTLSTVFGRLTTKIILAHLTRQPFPYWTALLAPLVGGAILVNLPYIGFAPVSAELQLYYLWAYFLFSSIVYVRWAYVVCTAICDFLGIQCLTIPEEKWKALQREKEAKRA
ncbi:Putative CDP-alcohol phosphatidyltransferase [Septoria linicola]|uniref:CDP-alcohol phosphatidyltransferase n=1 Tax=Septoria linicola TaxID=215465 RepID=A0A9Q9AYI2_9PEZI|nr:Putative CDP-alcohol phosphatidyltransferase [Septoria linicola]